MIKALNKLLDFKLISKKNALENLDKLLPFLLHPNTWIRKEVITYIQKLCDPSIRILNTAEAYCLVKPKLKKYLRKKQKVYTIYDNDLC